MLTEYDVREWPCDWCGSALGRYSYSPDELTWVHRSCEWWAWHEATPKQLGWYLDVLEEASLSRLEL